MTDFVTFTENDSHCLVTMDDGKANALGFDMLAQLDAALDQAEAAGKVLIIAGRPGKFSAGFDLSVMGAGGDTTLDLLRNGAGVSQRLVSFPVPVIVAATGHALAMGALLLLSADYRIGTSGTFKIGLNEVAIGMTLPWFGVELATARLAPQHLERAVSLAMMYDPAAAVDAGFLDETVEEAELLPRAVAVAGQCAALNMDAYRGSKARTREALITALEGAFDREFSQGPGI